MKSGNTKTQLHIDPSKIKTGQYPGQDGLLYNEDGTSAGPIPMKEYTSFEGWDNEVKQRAENIKLENNEAEFKVAFIADKKDAMHQIATYLIEKHSIKTIRGRRSRELFVYRNGVYISDEDTIKKDLRKILEELCSVHFVKEIIEAIKDRTAVDRSDFEIDPNLLNLNNGVFSIKTGELEKHDPRFMFLNKLPVNYRKNAHYPKIKNFLSQILEKDDISIIQEWFGYALYRVYFIKKALINVGEGDTGKTTLLRLLERFVGRENVSGVSLQKISADKFAAAHFYNKHVNIFDDLSFHDINDNGSFKIATGGGLITAEYKSGDQFQFENYSKLTFACNKIPDVKDANDPAYFNRWMVIHYRKEVTKPDKFLINKITSESELSGLFNFAIKGLKRLIKNQQFSYFRESHEIKTEMQLSGSATANFVHDCLEESTGDFISKDDMYEAFVKYVRLNNLPVNTKEYLGKKIKNYANYILDGKKSLQNQDTGKKNQVTGWKNVRFKENPDSGKEDVGPDIPEPNKQEPLIS